MNAAQGEVHSKEKERKMPLVEWEERPIAVGRQCKSEAALRDNCCIDGQNKDSEHAFNLSLSPSHSSSRTSFGVKCLLDNFPLTIVTLLTSSRRLFHDGDDFLGRTADEEKRGENENSWGIRCRRHLRGVVAKQRLRKFTPIHILPQAVANMQEEHDWKSKKSLNLLPPSIGEVPSPYEEKSYIHLNKNSSAAEVGNGKDSRSTFSSQWPLAPPLLLDRLQEPSSTHITLRCFLALRHCWKSGAYFHVPTWSGLYLLAPSWAVPTQLREGVHTKHKEGYEKVSQTIAPTTGTCSSDSLSLPSSSLQKRAAGVVGPLDICGSAFHDEAAVRSWCHRLHPRYGGLNTLALERQKRGENEEDPYYELQWFRNEKAKELYSASGTAEWEKAIVHPHHGHGNQMKGIERDVYDPNLLGENQREEVEEPHRSRHDKKKKRATKKQNMVDTPLYIPEQHLFELNDGIQWPLLSPILLEVMNCIFEDNKASDIFSSPLQLITNQKEEEMNAKLFDNACPVAKSLNDEDSQVGCDSSPPFLDVEGTSPRLLQKTPGKRIRIALMALLHFFRCHLQRLEVYDSNGGGWSREEEDLFIQESLSAWQALMQNAKRMDAATPTTKAPTTSTSNISGSAAHTSPLLSFPLSIEGKGKKEEKKWDAHEQENEVNQVASPMSHVSRLLPRGGEEKNIAVPVESHSRSAFFASSQGHHTEKKGSLHLMPTEEEVVAHSRRLFRAYTQKANCQLVICDDHRSLEGGEDGPSLSLPGYSENSPPLITLVPLEDISEGEELTLHYGREWWTEHFLYPLLLLREIVRDWNDPHRLQSRNPSIVVTSENPLESSFNEQQAEEKDESTRAMKSSASSVKSSSPSIASFLMKEIQEIERLVAQPEDVFEQFPILRLSLLKSAKKTKKRVKKSRSNDLSPPSASHENKNVGHDCHSSRNTPPTLKDVSKYQLRNLSTKQRFSSPSAVVAVSVQQSILDPSWLHDSLLFSSDVHHTAHYSGDPSSGIELPENQCKGNDEQLSCRVFDLKFPDQLVPISRLRKALKIKLLQQQREILTPTVSFSSLKEGGECEKNRDPLRKKEKCFDNLSSLYSTVLQRWGPFNLAFR